MYKVNNGQYIHTSMVSSTYFLHSVKSYHMTGAYVVTITSHFFLSTNTLTLICCIVDLIVSKFCPNVTETDICPYWGMSLDSLVYNSGTLPIELKG